MEPTWKPHEKHGRLTKQSDLQAKTAYFSHTIERNLPILTRFRPLTPIR